MASKKKTNKKTSVNPAQPPVREPQPKPTAQAPQPQASARAVPYLQAASPFPAKWLWVPPVMMACFFLMTCLSSASTVKAIVMTMVLGAIASCVIRFSYVRDRLSLPLMGVAAWVILNGISTFYAAAPSFALKEFLKIFLGFAVLLLVLAWSRKGRNSGRAWASILAGGTALASLVSIDMLSTHLISGPVLGLLGIFTPDYAVIGETPVEVGVRMTSLYDNPNVFAGVAGLGVLLALELAVTAEEKKERCFHLVCLFLNALAFILVFSMGASGMIALAFLALLLLERKERKASLLVLMVETFVLALAGAFPIFLTSFGGWTGMQPIPLLCALAGAALLCLADNLLHSKLSGVMEKGSGKLFGLLLGGVLALLVVFAALAVNLTGPAGLVAGEGLRRAEYPAAGTYTLNIQATGPVTVTIESQNQQETMMHTSTVLYSGDASGAQFTVPEGSLVTYFNFRAGEGLTLSEASFTGEAGTTALKLDYKLLPGFIANRLQGLFANENAIQRTVFFADGMKLFRRSPVFGLGLGAFESACPGVQSFYYETKYTHNNYVESLLTTGVVGLVLFVGMLGLCAAAVWKNLRRKEEADGLAPALGAALVFMAGHGAVEVIFSSCYYLPMALGVLGLVCLCCGQELPLLPERTKEEARSWVVAGLCGLMAVYAVLLGLNMQAESTVKARATLNTLASAAKMDLFEKNSYMLSYVVAAGDLDREEHWDIFLQASEYAEKLARVDSNTIPPYLARFYFSTGQPDQAIAMLKKHVNFLSANSEAWQQAFDILMAYYNQYPQCGEAAREIYEMFQTWNEEHMGSLTLNERNQTFISLIMGPPDAGNG